jgi:hypothetical protein
VAGGPVEGPAAAIGSFWGGSGGGGCPSGGSPGSTDHSEGRTGSSQGC